MSIAQKQCSLEDYLEKYSIQQLEKRKVWEKYELPPLIEAKGRKKKFSIFSMKTNKNDQPTRQSER